MLASLSFRLMLVAAAVAIGWSARLDTALLCAAPVLYLYLAVGEQQRLGRYARPMASLLLISATLWVFVGIDLRHPDWWQAVAVLAAPGAAFALVLRIAVASLLAVLAIGGAPDGQALSLAKSFGLSDTAAVLYAGALSIVVVIRESFERSIVALRAHGAISDRRRDLVRGLPHILSLTWTSSLDLTMGRAEFKWERNRFLTPGAPVFGLRSEARTRDNIACAVTVVTIAAILIGGRLWR